MEDGLLNAVRGGQAGASEYRVLNVPRVSVYKTAGGSQAAGGPPGVPGIISWDTEEYDSDSLWDASDPTKIKANHPGLYVVKGWWTWAADATVTRRMQLVKTDTTGATTSYFDPGGEIPAVGAGLTTTQKVSFDVSLNKGDYLTLGVWQFTAGGIAWSAATAALRRNGFQACLISTIG